MPKLYKTAQGRTVDIAAIMTQNERTRAVGNMKVNARGDIIDNQNQIVAPRNRQINRSLNAAVDKHIVAKAAPKSPERSIKKPSIQPDLPKQQISSTPEPSEMPAQGLAAALARANQNKESQ